MTSTHQSGRPHSLGIPRTGTGLWRGLRSRLYFVCAAGGILVATYGSRAAPIASLPSSKPPTVQAKEGESPTPYERTIKGLSEIASSIIERAVTEACQKRRVPDVQCGAVREAMVDQWHLLMDPKDQTVHDLIAKCLTMRTKATPPSADEVKAWADLAHTLLDKQVIRIRETQEQLRGDVKPERRAALELRVAIMSALADIGRERVERWQRGDFEAHEFWQDPARPPTPTGTGIVQPGAETPSPSVQPAPPLDPIGVELAGWAKYVKDFIQRFDLDEGQQDAAHSCLSELTSRANAHRQRYREELSALEQRIQSKETSPTIETEIKREIVRLYGPIDDMFAELKDRLRQIPTERQRRKVEPSQKGQPKRKP